MTLHRLQLGDSLGVAGAELMRKMAFAILFLWAVQGSAHLSGGEQTASVEELYNTGYLLTLLGQHEEALKLYDRSLAIRPTAQAYTYKGWTLSQVGAYQRAIEEAEKAIQLDPEFGNPYNDIGVYLIELGREDEAITYLEKAKIAKRYCCYQFPYFNLGRIYLKEKLYEKAREEFKKSLEIDPDYKPARQGLELLKELGFEKT